MAFAGEWGRGKKVQLLDGRAESKTQSCLSRTAAAVAAAEDM